MATELWKKKNNVLYRLDCKAFIIFMLHFRSSLPSESFCSFTPCVTHMPRVVMRKQSNAALMSTVSVDKLTADCFPTLSITHDLST